MPIHKETTYRVSVPFEIVADAVEKETGVRPGFCHQTRTYFFVNTRQPMLEFKWTQEETVDDTPPK